MLKSEYSVLNYTSQPKLYHKFEVIKKDNKTTKIMIEIPKIHKDNIGSIEKSTDFKDIISDYFMLSKDLITIKEID